MNEAQQETTKHAGGRPREYSETHLNLAHDYYRALPKDEVVHSIEGLAEYLDINRSTIYEWIKEKDKVEFSNIVSKILNKQGKTLINGGVSNVFNASITKLLLTKHGYRDAQELTGLDGKDLIPVDPKRKAIADDIIDQYLPQVTTKNGKTTTEGDTTEQQATGTKGTV